MDPKSAIKITVEKNYRKSQITQVEAFCKSEGILVLQHKPKGTLLLQGLPLSFYRLSKTFKQKSL